MTEGCDGEVQVGEIEKSFGNLQNDMIVQMESMRSPNGFYHDLITSSEHKSSYSLLPDIAYGILSEAIAYTAGCQNRNESSEKISITLESLHKSDKFKTAGFYPTGFDTSSATISNRDIKVCAVDNVHLFLANLAIASILPELEGMVKEINENMDFSFFYDPSAGLLHGVYMINEHRFQAYHTGTLASETRLASYVYMVQTGDFDHYYRLYRKIPKQFSDLEPETSTLTNTPPLDIHGGNLFESCLASLFLPEEIISPYPWSEQTKNLVTSEIEYGKKNLKGLWGHIPTYDSWNSKNDYVVAGIAELARNSAKVNSSVLSPHASMLVAPFYPDKVFNNLEMFKSQYPEIYRRNEGFFDSVNVNTGYVSKLHLSTNTGIALLGLNNYLDNWRIRDITSKYFSPIFPTIAQENLLHEQIEMK